MSSRPPVSSPLPWLLLTVVVVASSWGGCTGGCCGPSDGSFGLEPPAPPALDAANRGACGNDGDCPTGRRCVEGKCRAGGSAATAAVPKALSASDDSGSAMGCKSDRGCVAGELCVAGRCAAPSKCVGDQDCTGLLRCDTSTEHCRATICLEDSDCRRGVCVWGRCSERAPGCRGDDCPDGAYCNTQFNECESDACSVDDDCAGSRRCGGGLCRECQRDEDCRGHQTCRMPAGQCDEPAKCQQDSDCHPGRHCDAETTLCADPPCRADGFAASAKRETAPLIDEGEYDLTLCEGDDSDWFRVEVEAGDALRVGVEYDAELSTLSVRPYGPDSPDELTRFLDSGTSGTAIGELQHVATGGQYWIRVHSDAGDSTHYRLRVDVIEGGTCRDDDLEPNGSAETASRLRAGDDVSPRLCVGDEDWFALEGAREGALLSVFALDGPQPVFDLYRLDKGGPTPLRHNLLGEAHRAEVPLPGGTGRLLLRVSQADASEHAWYRVSLEP